MFTPSWIVRRCRALGLSDWDMMRLIRILYGKDSLNVLCERDREMFGEFLLRAMVVKRSE